MNDPLELAHRLIELNRPREAVAAARDAVSEDPHDPAALFVLARALLDAEETDEALATAERVCAMDPHDDQPHCLRALCHLDRGEPRLARSAIDEALRLAPQDPWSHAVLADVAIASGDGATARRAAERTLALAPHSTVGHLTLGRVEAAHGNDAEAARAFERALAVDPHDVAALHNLGVVRGETPEAMELLAQAARMAPADRLSARMIESRVAAAVVWWAAVTWFLLLVVLSLTEVAPLPRGVTFALRAFVPVATTAVFVRNLRRLPEGARRLFAGGLRRRVRSRRVAVPAGAAAALLAVLYAVPATRGAVWPVVAVLPLAGFVAWGEANREPKRLRDHADLGPVTPESLAPMPLRVGVALLNVLGIAILGVPAAVLGALVVGGLGILLSAPDARPWAVSGAVAGVVAIAFAVVLMGDKRSGANFGEDLAGIAVADVGTGEPIDRRLRLRRIAWWWVSWLTLGAGFLPGWRGRPTLADRRTHTAVVRHASENPD